MTCQRILTFTFEEAQSIGEPRGNQKCTRSTKAPTSTFQSFKDYQNQRAIWSFGHYVLKVSPKHFSKLTPNPLSLE